MSYFQSNTGLAGSQQIDARLFTPEDRSPGIDPAAVRTIIGPCFYPRKPQGVYWDELSLQPSERLFQEVLGYNYDDGTLALTLWYPPGGRHTLRVEWEQ